MKADESLIAQVRFKTTGATVHDVNIMIANYITWCRLTEEQDAEKADFENAVEHERLMRQFLYTGVLDDQFIPEHRKDKK